MGLTQGVKLKLLFWHIENGRSVISTQQKFRLHYKKKKASDRNTILDIVKNMEDNGSVVIKVQKKRPNTSRTPENIEKFKRKMTDSPHRSSRRLSAESTQKHSNEDHL